MASEYNSFEADKKRFRLWTAGIILVLLALAAAAWLSRPAYRHFKERRSAAQAQAFLASGNYPNAALSARQALMLNPTNVPACRVMATLADRSHNPVVLDFQRRIVQTEPTLENKLQLASAGLRYQSHPFPLTTQILDELAPVATNLASYHVVAASLALSLRRLDAAESHFETAIRLDPTNQLYEMNLAIVRLGGTNVAKAVSARTVLKQLRTDANLGLVALRALVVDRLAQKDAAAADDYSTQLLASARANLGDQLQSLGILQQLQRADFKARLQAVQQQTATNAPAVTQVAEWMQAHDLLAEEIFWLTNLPVTIQSQQPVRVALADAYLQGGDWPALRDFAAKGNWEEMDFLRLALLARAWAQLGVPQVADSNWGSAVNATDGRFGAMTTLLELAERWQLPREREDLLRRMVEIFPRERWVQQRLEQLYLADGNTAELNRLYARLAGLFPADAGYKNNLAFTSLLLQTNLPQAGQWAAEVYAANTNDAVITATYAFALHLQGRTKAGLAVLQNLDARLLQRPDVALYYGVLLAATGATNEAAPFLKIARSSHQWLPEEKQLLLAAPEEF